MRFGVMMRGQFPAGDDMGQRFAELVEQARLIDRLGYDSLTKGSHYSTHPLQDLQQVPFLARIAAEAPSLRLNTGVLLLPLHKPLDVAEQIGSLDIMSGGKAIFGVGVGYRDVELKAFGTSMKERGRRMDENLEAILRLWSEEKVSMTGSHFVLDQACCSAKPLQKPHPPIWVGGSADAAIRRAARLGSCWYIGPNDRLQAIEEQLEIYKRALEAAGRPFPAEFAFRREVFVAPTREKAWRLAEGPIMTKYKAYFSWGLGRSRPGVSDELGQGFEDLMRDRFFIGSPDEVADQLINFERRLGVNHVVMSMHWPGLDYRHALDSLRLTAAEVMPKVRAA